MSEEDAVAVADAEVSVAVLTSEDVETGVLDDEATSVADEEIPRTVSDAVETRTVDEAVAVAVADGELSAAFPELSDAVETESADAEDDDGLTKQDGADATTDTDEEAEVEVELATDKEIVEGDCRNRSFLFRPWWKCARLKGMARALVNVMKLRSWRMNVKNNIFERMWVTGAAKCRGDDGSKKKKKEGYLEGISRTIRTEVRIRASHGARRVLASFF